MDLLFQRKKYNKKNSVPSNFFQKKTQQILTTQQYNGYCCQVKPNIDIFFISFSLSQATNKLELFNELYLFMTYAFFNSISSLSFANIFGTGAHSAPMCLVASICTCIHQYCIHSPLCMHNINYFDVYDFIIVYT